MNETRREFMLAAGSAVAAFTLPEGMAGAADQATSSDKGAKAMDYQNAKQLIGLLQSRQVSAVELTDRAMNVRPMPHLELVGERVTARQ